MRWDVFDSLFSPRLRVQPARQRRSACRRSSPAAALTPDGQVEGILFPKKIRKRILMTALHGSDYAWVPISRPPLLPVASPGSTSPITSPAAASPQHAQGLTLSPEQENYLEGLRKFQRDFSKFRNTHDQHRSYLRPDNYMVHSELLDIPVPDRHPSRQGRSSHELFSDDTWRDNEAQIAKHVTRGLMQALGEQQRIIARLLDSALLRAAASGDAEQIALHRHECASLDAVLHDLQMKIGTNTCRLVSSLAHYLIPLPQLTTDCPKAAGRAVQRSTKC